MPRDTGDSFWLRCTGTTPQDRRNQLRLAGLSLVWALVLVGCKFLIDFELVSEGPIRWVVAALPTVAGVFLIGAFVRFLREADEFQRIVQLQALALGFGGSFFFLSGYSIFERVGAPEMSLADATTVMPFLYVVGMLLSWWRFR